jgi:ABC-2 type transport system permease protein
MLKWVVLRAMDLLAPVFRSAGLDDSTLRAFLDVKLTMDNRRAGSALYRNVDRKANNALWMTMIMYTLSGGIFAVILSRSTTLLAGMTLLFGFMMVLLGMSLIADLSTVLLDTSDFQILLPLPIDGKTLAVARILHVAVYLGLLVLSLGVFPLIAGTSRMGASFVPLFLMTSLGIAVLLVSATQAIYAFGLETLKGERFRDAVVYLQTFMVAFLMLSYFVTMRLSDMDVRIGIDLSRAWWVYLLPPAWFAAPFDGVAGSWSLTDIILSTLAVVMTLAALLLLLLVFGPRYHREVADLSVSGAGRQRKRRLGDEDSQFSAHPGISRSLRNGRPLTRSPAEEAAFGFTWAMVGRDREFRMRTLPLLALIPIYILFFLFNSQSSLSETLAGLRESDKYFYILYVVAYMAPASLLSLRYSTNWQAAWVYEVLPFQKAGEVLSGAVKAVVVRFYVPIYVAAAAAVAYVWGIRVIDDVLLSGTATLVAILLFSITAGRRYPFSEEFVVARGAGRSGLLMIFVFLPVMFGVIHSIISRRAPLLVWILLLFSIPAVGWLFRRLSQVEESQVRRQAARAISRSNSDS